MHERTPTTCLSTWGALLWMLFTAPGAFLSLGGWSLSIRSAGVSKCFVLDGTSATLSKEIGKMSQDARWKQTNWFFMKVVFSVRSWISFKEDEVWWWAMTGDGCKKWIRKWRCYDTSFLCLIRTAVLALVLTFDFNVIQEGWWMPSQDRLYNSSWWQPTTRRFQRQPLILKPREWEIRHPEEIGRLKAPGLIQRTQNSTVFSICLWNSLELFGLGQFCPKEFQLSLQNRYSQIQHWNWERFEAQVILKPLKHLQMFFIYMEPWKALGIEHQLIVTTRTEIANLRCNVNRMLMNMNGYFSFKKIAWDVECCSNCCMWSSNRSSKILQFVSKNLSPFCLFLLIYQKNSS